MRRLSFVIFGVLSFLVTSLGHSQTSSPVWFTLNAPEGSVITASAPITLRYGQVASTCAATLTYGSSCNGVPIGTPTTENWTSPKTFSPSGSTVSVSVNNGTFGDPLPGVYKTIQIQEKAASQIITVNGQNVTVPALPNSGGAPSSSVWFTLNAPEGTVITASAPITLRYGQVASTCAATLTYGSSCNGVPIGTPTTENWTSPKTFSPSGSSTVSVLINNGTFSDPLPGVYKTVQIQEQASPQTITVNGQNVTVPASSTSTCKLTSNPSVINFQNTTVGYTLASSAGLTSNCSSTINVSAVQISGPYSVSGIQTPFSIAPNQTRNYSVVFAPTSSGAANGTINFVNSANSGVSVTIYGTGVAAQQSSLSASPTSLSFGSHAINTSTSLVLTITNLSSISSTISSITVSGTGYSRSGITTPFTLSANQSRQLTVTFSPTTAGNATGAVTITGSGSTLTVPLTGSGTTSAPAHSVSLSWTASSSPQVAGYNVYRTITSGSGYTLLNKSPITATSYTDQTVNGGTTYYYVSTAISTSGAESSYSNQTSVTIPNP